jgi:multicomponent Na+:H+ antiporter subunit E
MVRRFVALAVWCYGIWLLLTWTVTAEQLVTAALVSVAVALALCPFHGIAAPWRLLDPRVLLAGVRLVLESLARIVRANLELAWRIWAPHRPLRSGMLIVPTRMRTDGGLGGVGLITSLIVDNQIVDLDRDRHLLQYHAVAVPEGSRAERAESVNAPVERMLAPIVREDES